jgi:N-hydroxyarylamine O-acetyltransferase
MTVQAVFNRYLSILGIDAEPPGIDHLNRLVRAQLIRVPFENISKLWLKKTRGAASIPSLTEHLDGIEGSNFGGTCYANNPYFYELLRHLGYDVSLCGADMSKADVHVVSIVRIEGREFLVDVGYGAPFFEAMPRDLDRDLDIRFGRSRYALRPQDDLGRSRMDMYRDGDLVHGYLAKPEPRKIDDFEEVIRDSYSDAATFMNALVVERFTDGGSVRFHNLKMSETTRDTTTTTELAGREHLVGMVERHCGIAADVVREAIDGIQLEADIYS